jgi:hypothetical protein
LSIHRLSKSSLVGGGVGEIAFKDDGQNLLKEKIVLRNRLILVVGLLVLFISAQNAKAGPITVTVANDYVQLTGQAAVTYTGTVIGSNTISTSANNAIASLTITRSSSSLDYLWSATPDFANTKGVGIRAVDDFTLSSPADFQLTFTGRYLDGYLWNTGTNTYVEKFGYKSGNVGPTPSFAISGSLMAGNYELRLNTGALPNGSPVSGDVHFVTAVPEPSLMLLLGIGFGGVTLASWRRKKA